MSDAQTKADLEHLLAQAQFRNFLWTVIQLSGLLSRSTDGSEGRHLAYDEGRRNLALEILEHVEQAQPAEHPQAVPILTLIQVLREEVQQQPSEKTNGRRSRNQYDRNRELDDRADGNDDNLA